MFNVKIQVDLYTHASMLNHKVFKNVRWDLTNDSKFYAVYPAYDVFRIESITVNCYKTR